MLSECIHASVFDTEAQGNACVKTISIVAIVHAPIFAKLKAFLLCTFLQSDCNKVVMTTL